MRKTIRTSRLISTLLMLIIAITLIAASSVTAFAAEPHVCSMNTATGKCTVCSQDMAEAQIGNVYYLTLAEAMSAATDGNTVMLRKSVVLSESTMTVKAGITLDVASGVIVSSNLTEVVLTNNGTITGKGIFNSAITSENNGTISGGLFNGVVTNNKTINGGSFLFYTVNYGIIEATENQKPIFDGSVTNHAEIKGGSFKNLVNEKDGVITDGTFSDTVNNRGEIAGGTYSASVYNSVLISDGIFDGTVTNSEGGAITAGAFKNPIQGSFSTSFEARSSKGYSYLSLSEALYKAGKLASDKAGITVTLLKSLDLTVNETVPEFVSLGMSSGAVLSGDGYLLTVYGTLIGGNYAIDVCNCGTVTSGVFDGLFENRGKVQNGTYNAHFTNTAASAVKNLDLPTVLGGSFNSTVSNAGLITGGKFIDKVSNSGKISSAGIGSFPIFESEVENTGSITGGAFRDGEIALVSFDLVEYDPKEGVRNYYHVRTVDALSYLKNKSKVDLVILRDIEVTELTALEIAANITLTTDGDAREFDFVIAKIEEDEIKKGGSITNRGEIRGSIAFDKDIAVTNYGVISDGRFAGKVTNRSLISGGQLEGEVINYSRISGGIFDGSVNNTHTVVINNEGTIYQSVTVTQAEISGGVFNGKVYNTGIVTGGIFSEQSKVENDRYEFYVKDEGTRVIYGTIYLGVFNGEVVNHAHVTESAWGLFPVFNGTVTNDGTILHGAFKNKEIYGEVPVDLEVECGGYNYISINDCLGVINTDMSLQSGIVYEIKAIRNILITSDIVLTENTALSCAGYTLGSVGGFTVTNYGVIRDGSYNVRILNAGVIESGIFTLEIDNSGVIESGLFDGALTSSGTIKDGIYNREVTSSGSILDGTFNSAVTNSGTITDGSFRYPVNNSHKILGGIFYDNVTNSGEILDGEFILCVDNTGLISGGEFTDVVNNGTITGGVFDGRVTNYKSIVDGSFKGSVLNEKSGIIDGGSFNCPLENFGTVNDGLFTASVTNFSDGILLGGVYDGRVVNNGTITYADGGAITFNGAVTNESGGKILKGSFTSTATVTNHGVIEDGIFDAVLTVGLTGVVSGGIFNASTDNGGKIENGEFNAIIRNSGDIVDGEFNAIVRNSGDIVDGEFNARVENLSGGEILDGVYNAEVTNSGLIFDGDFYGELYNDVGGKVHGGTFYEAVSNGGEIIDGLFLAAVDNSGTGTISGGRFVAFVNNFGVISGGLFEFTVSNRGYILEGEYMSDVEQYGSISGGKFHLPIINNGTISGGHFLAEVINSEEKTISGGTFDAAITNNGAVLGGVFSAKVENNAKITGGSFYAEVVNADGKEIAGGSFFGTVTNNGLLKNGVFSADVLNYGKILGGSFESAVTNCDGKEIAGGSFSGPVVNKGTVSGGIFSGELLNESGREITGGTFYGKVDNAGIIKDGLFDGVVALIGEGSITGGAFRINIPGLFEARVNDYHYLTFERALEVAVSVGKCDLILVLDRVLNEDREIPAGVVFSMESGVRFLGDGTITNKGEIIGGIFELQLVNDGIISGGSFSATVVNGGLISDGRFSARVVNSDGATVTGGTFKGSFSNIGTASGGLFDGGVENDGIIEGGKYNCKVENKASGLITHRVVDGEGTVPIFSSSLINSGRVEGGAFAGGMSNIDELLAEFEFGAHIKAPKDEGVAYYFFGLADALLAAYEDIFRNTTVYLYESTPSPENKGYTEGVIIKDGVTIDAEAYATGVVEDGEEIVGRVYYRLFEHALTDLDDGDLMLLVNKMLYKSAELKSGVSLDMLGDTELVRSSSKVIFTNSGAILGGTYNIEVINSVGATVDGGVFNNDVSNHGSINGGSFRKVTNSKDATIYGGAFSGEVLNEGSVIYGVFSGALINKGSVSGGSFIGAVTNDGTLSGGSFSGNVTTRGTLSGGTYNTIILEGGNIDLAESEDNEFDIKVPRGIFDEWVLGEDIKLPPEFVMHVIRADGEFSRGDNGDKLLKTKITDGDWVRVSIHEHTFVIEGDSSSHWYKCTGCGFITGTHDADWEPDVKCEDEQNCNVCGVANPDHGHKFDEFTHLCIYCGKDEFAEEKAIVMTVTVVVVLITMVLVLVFALIVKNKYGDIMHILRRY